MDAIDRYLGWFFNEPKMGAVHEPSKDSQDPLMAERLWELSEGMTGTDPMFRSANRSLERRFRELTRKP